MASPRYPSLFQLNTRVWLTERSRELGRKATLDDIADETLAELSRQGFDWLWLLSVWQTGEGARAISRANPEWREEFQRTLPDLTDDDIGGSGFAITGYRVHRNLGGDEALARLRERLRRHGLKLMLDFVPNHMALDHPWTVEHPDYLVNGTEEDFAREPFNYFRFPAAEGMRVFAHGRDPNFSGWPDTVQLDYGNPALQEAMREELIRIAGQCDGVRCDMAMLILPEIFDRTWRRHMEPFWPDAIRQVKDAVPGFVFLAEVYWDREWEMQQQGFDYCYDKRLYDRLRDGAAGPVRDHLRAGLDYQDRLARFLENHDEQRAAVMFDGPRHRAAAVLTFLTPGLRFLHQGQLEGRRVRISPHLVRGPEEAPDQSLIKLYNQILDVLREPAIRNGRWSLLSAGSAWEGNGSHHELIAYCWESQDGEIPFLIAVNFSDHQSQGKIVVPFAPEGSVTVHFDDLLTGHPYDWDSGVLRHEGIYVDLAPWDAHVFRVTPGT